MLKNSNISSHLVPTRTTIPRSKWRNLNVPKTVIVSELSRHDGAKKQIATYQRQFPTATHLICLRRRKDWVVYGRIV
jgi:hypothetical protein